MPGAAADILRTLEAFNLTWDGAVLYQSRRHEAYADSIMQLDALQATYPCACTRKSIAEALKKSGGRIYPGTCRQGLAPGTRARAIRLRVAEQEAAFNDLLQGRQSTRLDKNVGDFVIRRADGFYAYQLAVVVDDAHQGITHIVRGADLLAETLPQLYLQSLLGHSPPAYAHLPIAVNAQGEKLSKQTYAEPIDRKHPAPALAQALCFLGHPPEPAVDRHNARELLDWALAHWDIARVPKRLSIPA
jgi:glutamyl-Q tRNA(Asp) synthetase